MDAGHAARMAPALHHRSYLVGRERDDVARQKQAQGSHLVVTNRKIRFSALQHGGEVALSKVLRVTWLNQQMISLEATTRTLSGHYSTNDPEWAAAVIDTALRIDRRIILPGASPNGSRAIPHHVKTAVWQRDRGRCIQCNADAYLEFDHIIPWSKGGASPVGNIQLLCRRCNLTKSDRI